MTPEGNKNSSWSGPERKNTPGRNSALATQHPILVYHCDGIALKSKELNEIFRFPGGGGDKLTHRDFGLFVCPFNTNKHKFGVIKIKINNKSIRSRKRRLVFGLPPPSGAGILGKFFAAAVRTAAVVVPSGSGTFCRGVLRPSWMYNELHEYVSACRRNILPRGRLTGRARFQETQFGDPASKYSGRKLNVDGANTAV
ncbi:hypothetical protein OUZ56_024603 [Daphnia magna]|uniref:GMP synthase n=1 Tax=Daphnia magna TaxID=35525 RepID=A0ABR0B122_9CRUS|nr:hypothetical protein OUZ56_024603 [Daphnia magna]